MLTDQDNTPLMIGLSIPLALLLVLVVIILLLRRRRHAAKNTTENRASDTLSLPDSVIETRYVVIFSKLILLDIF